MPGQWEWLFLLVLDHLCVAYVSGRSVAGRITAIAGAPDRKPEWGKGRYFTVEVALAKQGELALLPGMSARVTPRDAVPAKAAVR